MKSLLRAAAAWTATLATALAGLTATTPAAALPSPDDQPVRNRLSSDPRPSPAPGGTASKVSGKLGGRPTVTVRGKRYPAPNPYLAQQLSGTRVDWDYWRARVSREGLRRATARKVGNRRVPVPYAHTEAEPVRRPGSNDGPSTAERLVDFGVDAPRQAVDVRGSLALGHAAARRIHTREDQGAIGRATPMRTTAAVPRVVVSSRIGDGPHGRRGSGRGDFDFYRVAVKAGEAIRATTVGSRMDTMLFVYDVRGRIVAENDDAGEEITSDVLHQVPAAGTYYVMVAGFNDFAYPTPRDPSRSGSGRGAGDQGAYQLQVVVRPVDQDFYGVRLEPGDLLGGTLRGSASRIQVHKLGGRRMVGSEQDASSTYPVQSPLPGGGATFAYDAEEPGWYAVSVTGGDGAYRMLLEAYPPGTEAEAPGQVQKIFLDFDGARVNTNIFYGDGVRTLAPMRRFLPRWGLSAGDEDALVDATVASVEENIKETLAAEGNNPDLRVEVLNSRDHADPFGRPNVSRVIVGGSIAQAGIPTIGIAQSIDPGNYAHEETALMLLDEISARAGLEHSLNTYLRSGSDRVGFIGRALGNLVSHEVGHFVGSYHTTNANRRANLMDAGGDGYAQMYGVGADRVGGTRDDTDVDFATDGHDLDEGFTGLQDTLNNSAWAFLAGRPS